ncbi:hypothetical protein [Shinella sedimenti]|uniref:Uncharacterized protein n=1 Tax=Shinella sedimenti TaxID=2919913 RepID=A0ABT0CT40_9HYPH|nr:hypothetical protein [Shinella sedimenti]MCJ8151766.1 hypothetical protein [Shinella sedimenti]
MVIKRLFSAFRKRPATIRAEAPSATELQDAVVRSIVDDRINLHDFEWEDRDWVYIAVNHELLIEDGRRSSTQTAVLAHKPGGSLEDLSFRLSPTSKQKLIALQEAMRQVDEKPWAIVDIAIERDGRYQFHFSYGEPPRISGDLLHSPLTGLLDRYKSERGLK